MFTVIAGGLYALIGVAFGLIVADADQNLPFIKHRSALTHGPLLPLLVIAEPLTRPESQYAATGFFLGYAVHLIFDMWPKKWQGIAKIHLIASWRMPPLLSFAWLGLGAFFALVNVSRWGGQQAWWSPSLLALLVAVVFGYKAHSEHKIIMPAITLIGLTLLALGGVHGL